MIKMLFLLVLVALGLSLSAQSYTAARAHNDSVLIYETYKDQIDFLEHAAKESKIQDWYKRSAYDDSATNCARLRLKKWNKEDYTSTKVREFEGYGTAYLYPEPVGCKKAKFSVTDQQTKFITRPDGKTKSPYIEKTWFDDDGMIVSVEQLAPSKN